MSSRPPVSVVVPILNEAERLRASLQPLQRHRGHTIELIVVDGGSSDASLEIAAGLADQVLTAPRGRAAQMNHGAAAAAGELIWFLHADVVIGDACIPLLQQAATRQLPWGRFSVRLDGRSPLLRVIARAMEWRSRGSAICTGDQGIFVRRELFEAIGGYPAIPLMEDIALSKMLRARARPTVLAATLTASARKWEAHGLWRTVFLMWRLRAAYALGADPARLARAYYGHG